MQEYGRNYREEKKMIKLWSIPSGWPNKQIGEIEKKKGTHYINFSIGKMLNANEIVSPTFVFRCNKKICMMFCLILDCFHWYLKG